MKESNKKVVIGVVAAVVIVAGGMIYSHNKPSKSINGNNVEINNNQGNKPASDSTSENSKEDPKNKIVKNDDLTKKITSENIVIDGQVYVQGEYAMGTMIIKDNVSQDKITKVAQEYANKLKSQYKDKKVNVQAVQNGKNVANITVK